MEPVFKKGEKYNAANYRPVTLTSICCKTIEHIIVSNINKHLAFESILADCQHGFRSRRSCENQLVQFYHDLVSNLNRALNRDQKQTDVIIMDFAKASDKVPHRRILYKRVLRDKRIYSQVDQLVALCALSKSDWMAKPQFQSWSYLVSPKDRSWDRSYFSFLLMISWKISGHLFVSSLMIAFCIGT